VNAGVVAGKNKPREDSVDEDNSKHVHREIGAKRRPKPFVDNIG
jgi:hypothetical protein